MCAIHPRRVIPRAAHNANMDNPGVFNQLLGEFLQGTVVNA